MRTTGSTVAIATGTVAPRKHGCGMTAAESEQNFRFRPVPAIHHIGSNVSSWRNKNRRPEGSSLIHYSLGSRMTPAVK
jgi:hypothetical protein